MDYNSFETISFQPTAKDDLITTPYSYSPSSSKPDLFPGNYTITAVKIDNSIYSVSGSSPTIYNWIKDYTNKKLNTPYRFIIAVCMAFVNFFFPIVNRTVCDVSVNRPSTLKRAFDFALRAFYVVDKDSLEMANATIKCIGIHTDKRNYQPVFITVVTVIAVFLIALLANFVRIIWIRYNHLPVFRPLDHTTIPSPDLHINENLLYRGRRQRTPFERGLLRELGLYWLD